MKHFLAHITPPCRDVIRLVSKSMDRTLPWTTRLTLWLHYRICSACAEYRRQLTAVRQVLRRSASADSQHEPHLPSSAKTRLKEAFKAKADSPH